MTILRWTTKDGSDLLQQIYMSEWDKPSPLQTPLLMAHIFSFQLILRHLETFYLITYLLPSPILCNHSHMNLSHPALFVITTLLTPKFITKWHKSSVGNQHLYPILSSVCSFQYNRYSETNKSLLFRNINAFDLRKVIS